MRGGFSSPRVVNVTLENEGSWSNGTTAGRVDGTITHKGRRRRLKRPNVALVASNAPNATLGAFNAPNATLGRIGVGLYAVTLAWLLSLLNRGRRVGWWLGTVFAAGIGADMTMLVGQVVFRGRTLHFNQATAADRAINNYQKGRK